MCVQTDERSFITTYPMSNEKTSFPVITIEIYLMGANRRNRFKSQSSKSCHVIEEYLMPMYPTV